MEHNPNVPDHQPVYIYGHVTTVTTPSQKETHFGWVSSTFSHRWILHMHFMWILHMRFMEIPSDAGFVEHLQQKLGNHG